MLLHAMSVVLAQRLRLEIELYRERTRLVVLPPPCPHDVQPITFSRAGELIDLALTESRTFLDGLDANPSPAARTRPARRLEPHSHGTHEPSGAQSPSHVSKSRRPQATRKPRRATRSH
jgi:NTE family protein